MNVKILNFNKILAYQIFIPAHKTKNIKIFFISFFSSEKPKNFQKFDWLISILFSDALIFHSETSSRATSYPLTHFPRWKKVKLCQLFSWHKRRRFRRFSVSVSNRVTVVSGNSHFPVCTSEKWLLGRFWLYPFRFFLSVRISGSFSDNEFFLIS